MAQRFDDYTTDNVLTHYGMYGFKHDKKSRFVTTDVDYNKIFLAELFKQIQYRNRSIEYVPNTTQSTKSFLVIILMGIANTIMIPYSVLLLQPSDAYVVSFVAILGLITVALLFVAVYSKKNIKLTFFK